MKRRALAILGLVALLGASNVAGVAAAGVDNKDARSSATFTLKDSGTVDPTDPVDPEEPEVPIDPEEPGTGNTGSLRIDYVSNFKFGAEDIQSGEQELFAAPVKADREDQDDDYEVPNFVQVSDWRGTGDGWKVTVKQEKPFEVTSGDRFVGTQMEGTEIEITNVTANAVDQDDIVSSVANSIVLNGTSGDEFVFAAEEGEGLGTHVAYFGNLNKGVDATAEKSVKLTIPAGANKLAETYETSLLWTVSSTVEND